MKHIRAILLLLAVSLLLGGCSFKLAASAEELINPITPTGINADVQNALNSFCKGGYTLKTPLSGNYTTSFIFYDIDLDYEDEAIVFYQESSNPERTDMAVIDKNGDNWSVICNVEGDGADVYSVDFCNLNSDPYAEPVVLWDTIKNSSNHLLSAYRQNYDGNTLKITKIGKSMTVSNYIPVDIDSTGIDELLVFTVSGGKSPLAKATLYKLERNSFNARSSTKLDGHITGYKSIISENTDKGFCVFADAVKTDGNQMLTELIIWSDYYGEIIAPYYSYSTGTTGNTTRKSMISSMDVNGDGYIELPLDADGIKLPGQVEAINWKQYRNSVLRHVCYTLAVKKDGYQVLIPDDYFKEISVSYDTENSEMTVNDKKGKLVFSINFLLKSQYNDNPSAYADYTEMMSDSGYIYLAVCGNDSDIKITTDELKSMIKSYEGE